VDLKNSYHWRRQLMWGLLLVGAGLAIFLDQFDIVELDGLWRFSPLLVIIGINRMIGYPSPRDISSGLWTTFLGVWVFAVFEGLSGLTFRNSWPIVIIAAGAKLILEPFIARRFASNKEYGHEE
jgi:hypothetical protein